MLLDKAPVDLNTQTGQVVQMDHTIAHRWAFGIQTVLDWMALGIPMRFHRKGTGVERRDEMTVNVGGSMGRNKHAVLFCQRGNAQRFGEAGVPCGIELHKANGARGNEITHGETMPFPLPMRQWDSDGRRKADIVGWLQIPV
jgi:hypothetical protein